MNLPEFETTEIKFKVGRIFGSFRTLTDLTTFTRNSHRGHREPFVE